MRRAALALAILASCSRSNPSTSAPSSASATVSVAPSTTAPVNAQSDLAIVGSDLVDLGSMTVLHTLTTDVFFASTIGGTTAYLWTKVVDRVGELRAYDVASGKLRWAKPAVECSYRAATSTGVFCGGQPGVRWFRNTDGADKVLSPRRVSSIAALGPRVVALSDTQLDSFDESGAPIGTTATPGPPGRGEMYTTLEVAESLACGARHTEISTMVFCVDGSPRVVWSRNVPVPSGILRQVDADLTLVTSGSTTAASEILRTSDGTFLLHSAGVRLSAAIATKGVFDAALSAEPDVALYDAKGRKKWTRQGSSFYQALRAIRIGSAIVIAQYGRSVPGVALYAVDEASGTLTWGANVDLLPMAGSIYSSDVVLRNRGNSVLLLGHESGQEYAETFDPLTGARIASILRKF